MTSSRTETGEAEGPDVGLLDDLLRQRLDNGAALWLLPMADQPFVSVRLLVPAGAQFEREREAGLAHLVEHFAFDFTRTPAMAEVFNALEDAGGELGAVTGHEEVVFGAEVPRSHLASTLELLCDCFEGAAFDRETVEAERRVLLRELSDYSAGDRDRGDLSRSTWKRLLGSHPSTREPAGEAAVIEAVGADRIREFFESHYGSEGLTLILTGDVDADEARALAERTLGSLPRRSAPTEPPPPRSAEGPIRFRDPEVWDEMLLGYRTDGVLSPDYFAHWYTRDYLTEELYDDVRRKHHVYYLACDLVARRGTGLLYVLVRAGEADHDAILRRIDAAFSTLAAGPLDDERFARLRARLVNRARRIGETPDEMAEHLVTLAAHFGLDDEVPDDLARLGEVSAEDLHAAARRCFVPERRVEARSKRRAVGSRLRAMLLFVALIVAVVGLQERCHEGREAALQRRLDECEAARAAEGAAEQTSAALPPRAPEPEGPGRPEGGADADLDGTLD